MGRRCTICDSASRPLIEQAILERVRTREIVERHGVTRRQLEGHRAHMVAEAGEALGLARQGLLALPPNMSPEREGRLVRTLSARDEFLDLLDRVKQVMRSSESDKVQIAAVAEARQLLDTMLGLALLESGAEPGLRDVTGSADPPWHRVREVLSDAGEKYPEARRGLEYALELLSHEP